MTAVLLAGSGTAYACNSASDPTSHTAVRASLLTSQDLTALKTFLAKEAVKVRAAKAAEIAAIKAKNRADAIAAAKRLAALKAEIRARVEAAIAKARAEAKAREEAKGAAGVKAQDRDKFFDPSRHHCDGHWGDHDGRNASWDWRR
jgi:hypothetical protein